MKFHPLASLFPLLEGEDFETLTESIRANGLREAIVLHPDGSVLDGRNRLRACLKAGVEPRFDHGKQKGNTMSNHCDCDCEEHMRLFEEAALRGHLLRAAILIDDDGEGEEVWMITPFDKEGQSCGKPSILADIGDWIERMPVVYDDTADLPAPVQHISVHGYPLKN